MEAHIATQPSRCKHKQKKKKTYLGGADAAVLFLLKGRGSSLGSLDELELALAARHARGLRHLDDAANVNWRLRSRDGGEEMVTELQ